MNRPKQGLGWKKAGRLVMLVLLLEGRAAVAAARSSRSGETIKDMVPVPLDSDVRDKRSRTS